MSDLNDFFAKKDKKKKKGAKGKAAGAEVPVGSAASRKTGLESSTTVSAADASKSAESKTTANRPSKGDDGWIDIEDDQKAQVNTGGRTVADFKRDNDDKVANGDSDAPVEKFSGWTIKNGGDEEQPAAPAEAAAPAGLYPSLAETADAPLVPKNVGSSGGGSTATRPRYGQSSGGFGALRKLLEQRNAAEAAGTKPSE